MKLELKHLAPYLPYGLQFILTVDHSEDFSNEDYFEPGIFDEGCIWKLAGYADPDLNIPMGEGEINGYIFNYGSTYASFCNGVKPVLRPHSDLTKLITVNNESFIPNDRVMCFEDKELCKTHFIHMPYGWVDRLFEWHFDVFGLIEAGLAIDINTLSP